MIQILEYIAQNYTSILSVLILILLAIIGYYADKTNFGQGKNKEKEITEKIDKNKKINDVIDKEESLVESVKPLNIEEKSVEKVEPLNIEEKSTEKVEQLNIEEKKLVSSEEIKENEVKNNTLQPKEKSKVEETKEAFDEIDSLLPKKELINSDLLNEIEGMELNSLKEKNSFDIPDLDNISLPKIKNLVEKEQDIWKF